MHRRSDWQDTSSAHLIVERWQYIYKICEDWPWQSAKSTVLQCDVCIHMILEMKIASCLKY